MRRITLLIFALVALLPGCGRGGGGPAQPPPPTPMPPPVPLYYDNGGGIRDSLRDVIREPARFASIWQRATSTQATPPSVPPVDFSRDMVIVVATGRMTPEDQIHVDSLLVRRELMSSGNREETLTIVVRTVTGCGRFRADAFPVEIVRARRFDGPIRWEERAVRAECRDDPAAAAAARPGLTRALAR